MVITGYNYHSIVNVLHIMCTSSIQCALAALVDGSAVRQHGKSASVQYQDGTAAAQKSLILSALRLMLPVGY